MSGPILGIDNGGTKLAVGVATTSAVSVDSKSNVMSFQTSSAAFNSGQPLAASLRMSGPSST